MPPRSRGWCFTLNNYDEEDETRLQALVCRYLVYGREEAPETGTRHLQGFIYFDNPRTFGGVRTLLGERAHVEATRGSAQQNREYCIKDGSFFECGEIPASPADGGDYERNRWAHARFAALEGRFDEIPDDLYIRYQASLKRIRREDIMEPNDLPWKQHYGVWLYGPPRTGKSHRARHDYGVVYLKDLNKWWDGYNFERTVLLDELSPEHASYMVGFLKRWADRWTFAAECKGGKMVIRPELIIVTSNYSIDEVFANCTQVDRDAINSRFECIEMNDVVNFPEGL